MPGPVRTAQNISDSSVHAIAPLLQDDGIRIEILEIHGRKTNVVDVSGKSLRMDLRAAEGIWGRLDAMTLVGGFRFVLALSARSAGDHDDSTVFAELATHLQFIYTFTESIAERADDQLENFMGYYGFIHVWPYARAEFQALTAKLGVPPLTLPVLKTGRLPTALSIRQVFPEDEISVTGDATATGPR
jgi:hypothetical protein